MKESIPELNFTAPATAAASGVTPGKLLRAARQEQGLSVIDVAARLCLNVRIVEDIERDDYSRMLARVYARGHVMSYAHLLGIPEAQISPALVNMRMDFVPPKSAVVTDKEQTAPIYQAMESSQQRFSLVLWGTILVLIVLAGLMLIWWNSAATSGKKTPHPAAPTTSTNISIEPRAPAPAPPPPPAAFPKAPEPLPPPTSTQQPTTNNRQSVLQPSEFRDPGNPPPLSVNLPTPRASSNP